MVVQVFNYSLANPAATQLFGNDGPVAAYQEDGRDAVEVVPLVESVLRATAVYHLRPCGLVLIERLTPCLVLDIHRYADDIKSLVLKLIVHGTPFRKSLK